ncbi:aminoglycoside phosphotransferase family protein [Candidatus Berkiella cookevillensis]|uniref:Aminoglycoside phosphotransferase family protein n=1 Tax=Candidatus Berkiella cookevillensis TaxID=437022 RepID=A0A0Q9YBA1_9GAMM|nr:phosphotransferase [Candidatus Berkiella cookevillensis]MCS5709123.1 aminoglycoside phosphotransferase family protein [Candidatus Berkiella cookevillensis]
MLNKISNMLFEYDYINSKDKIYFSSRLVDNWSMLVFAPPKKFYHIKINTHKDLKTECKNLKKIQNKYSEYIPQFIDYIEYEGYEFLICQAYQHEAFNKAQIEASTDLQDKLKYYFISSIADWSLQRKHDESTLQIEKSFGLEDEVAVHLAKLYSQAMSWGYQPQHGDFVLNNIAITRGHLIVFDWEDYARVNIVGFDLAIFLYSIHQFNSATLFEALATEKLDRIIMSYLTALNISKQSFMQLLPLYLYLFLVLKEKQGYSKESVLRTKESLLASYAMLKAMP